VDAALAAWRRKAADILMAATTAVHLPAVVIVALGHGPLLGSLTRVVAVTAYLVMAAAALLRRVRYRTRLLACFFAAYLVTAGANLAALRGPYAQVGLVVDRYGRQISPQPVVRFHHTLVVKLVYTHGRPARLTIDSLRGCLPELPFWEVSETQHLEGSAPCPDCRRCAS
jgi:hypothetical protein